MNAVEQLIAELSSNQNFINKMAESVGPALLKADAFTGGANGQQLVGYNLDPVVEFLYPFLKNVPLVAGQVSSDGKFKYNPIPRTRSKGGTAAHWKTITAIDINNVAGGVGRGQRGGAMQITSNDLNSPFYGMGVEVPTDFESQYEAGDLLTPTPLAIATQSGLRALMIFEEKMVIGGNSSLALGTTPTPSVTDGASSGGTITQGGSTLSVICVALTNDGKLRGSVTGGIQPVIARQNMDGSTLSFGGGCAQKSVAGTLSLTASHTALVTVAAVSGAVAYAWFWGASGSEKLGAITPISGIELKADAAGTQLASSLPASDNSKNGYVPDGIITQMCGSSFGSSSNSYVSYVGNGAGAGGTAGTVGGGNGLTADGAGGIVEFDALLKDRWDNFRLGFTRILINSQESNNIKKKILQQPSGVTSLFRVAAEYKDGLRGGFRLVSYHNQYTGEDLDIVIHPWVPPGYIIFWSDSVPYPLSNVGNIIEFETRQGYYQIDWPLATRQWQSGVYVDEAFKNKFTPAYAFLGNLGNN